MCNTYMSLCFGSNLKSWIQIFLSLFFIILFRHVISSVPKFQPYILAMGKRNVCCRMLHSNGNIVSNTNTITLKPVMNPKMRGKKSSGLQAYEANTGYKTALKN